MEQGIILTIVGMFIAFVTGAAVPMINAYYQRKHEIKKQENERLDKYKLAAIEKRLEVAQNAFYIWTILKDVIHHQHDFDKQAILDKAVDFWKHNCLYLSKDSSSLFWDIIIIAGDYPGIRDSVKTAITEIEKEQARQNINDAWNKFWGFPNVLTAEMDLTIPKELTAENNSKNNDQEKVVEKIL